MKIIVTGSAGFIGSYIAKALADRSDTVWGLDNGQGGRNVPAGFVEARDATVPGVDGAPNAVLTWNDLADGWSDLVQHFGRFRPDVLVHLAANAREGASQFQPESVTRAGLWAYARVLRAAIAAGSLRRVVLFSSMARYGVGEGPPPFDERFRPQPVDVYAANKVAMEATTTALAKVHGFAPVILVPHNVFGPGQAFDRYRNVVTIFCNQIMRGEPMTIFGDGTQRRAFSFIDDSVPCYLRAVDGAADGLTVNIGGRVDIPVNELAGAVAAAMNAPGHPVEHLPDRPLEVKDAWCTTARSVETLGYREVVGWAGGVKRTCAWARELGPQEWIHDPLELPSPAAPAHWAKP